MGVSTYKSWDDPPSRCCCFGTNFGCAPQKLGKMKQFCRDFFVEAPRFQSAHQPRWCFQVFSAEADQKRLHEEVQQQAMKMSSVALVVWSNKRPGQTSPAVIRLCHKTLCSWRRGRPFNGLRRHMAEPKKKRGQTANTSRGIHTLLLGPPPSPPQGCRAWISREDFFRVKWDRFSMSGGSSGFPPSVMLVRLAYPQWCHSAVVTKNTWLMKKTGWLGYIGDEIHPIIRGLFQKPLWL